MDIPEGFVPFENRGPYREYIGPIHVRQGSDELVLGLRAEDRHADHRGRAACCRRSAISRWTVRSRLSAARWPSPTARWPSTGARSSARAWIVAG
jgi:hypothetical protein